MCNKNYSLQIKKKKKNDWPLLKLRDSLPRFLIISTPNVDRSRENDRSERKIKCNLIGGKMTIPKKTHERKLNSSNKSWGRSKKIT